MNEKDNLKDNLIHKAQDKDKSFPKSRQFFFEDNSNTESIKNSEALSEYDDEIASEKDINSYRHSINNNNNGYAFLGVANKSYSHKAVNSIKNF